MNNHQILTDEIVKLLQGGTAHASFQDAIDGLAPELRGERPYGLPYSIWQLVEHIRIAQWDMLEFSKDGNHQSPKWPDDYWPKEAAPKDNEAWDNSIKQIESDLEEFIRLLKSEDIYTKIPHGDGQTILREALQMADHTSYHISEIILIRRLLKAWK
ncbi:DinB family protein [Mucilaginibacter sp. KACC 22063]|uniref:DinB family protein n=1 Tax=Mucilaginibacter sp. KACC 22063 TaxID=3025666 RepID=UPI002366326E|nr:DinB family protein [Mucilaginibacter sp. KACC 22063]WDF56590.1 DinB family protein [Mucilaginibacter sp. KACC 22063]